MRNRRRVPMQILVVDDQISDVVGFQAMARFLEAEVTLAFDGQQGLILAMTKKFDLIILDWHMPTVPGWAFLKHLETKYRDPSSRLPRSQNIVLHTGESLRAEEFCADIPFRILDVWQKPLSPLDLLKKMKAVHRAIGA